MITLMGVKLANEKRLLYALTSIYGIGIKLSARILKSLNIPSKIKINDLTSEKIIKLRQTLENKKLKLEGNLRRFNGLNVKRLIEINCYRGKRHKNNLPVRGQRTRTNASSKRKIKK